MPKIALALTASAALLSMAACGRSGGNPLSTGSSSSSGGGAGSGGVTVGSADFPESALLAEIYAGALEAKGVKVSKKLNIGSREVYFPALKRGEVDLIPDYAGSLLTFIDKNKPATTDPATNARSLAGVLQPLKLTALNYSKAQDINGFVVTKATADRYHLVKISDLGKPAS